MYKHFTDKGGISTPCIVHWPAGIEQGGCWLRKPAHLVDLMPTLCEIAGAEYPERVEELAEAWTEWATRVGVKGF